MEKRFPEFLDLLLSILCVSAAKSKNLSDMVVNKKPREPPKKAC